MKTQEQVKALEKAIENVSFSIKSMNINNPTSIELVYGDEDNLTDDESEYLFDLVQDFQIWDMYHETMEDTIWTYDQLNELLSEFKIELENLSSENNSKNRKSKIFSEDGKHIFNINVNEKPSGTITTILNLNGDKELVLKEKNNGEGFEIKKINIKNLSYSDLLNFLILIEFNSEFVEESGINALQPKLVKLENGYKITSKN